MIPFLSDVGGECLRQHIDNASGHGVPPERRDERAVSLSGISHAGGNPAMLTRIFPAGINRIYFATSHIPPRISPQPNICGIVIASFRNTQDEMRTKMISRLITIGYATLRLRRERTYE